MTLVRVHILAAGRVQGVGFRAGVKRKAEKLGLKGWVRNLSDGKVEIRAEGPWKNLKEFAGWVRKGTFFAKVSDVSIEWEENKNEFNNFKIIR